MEIGIRVGMENLHSTPLKARGTPPVTAAGAEPDAAADTAHLALGPTSGQQQVWGPEVVLHP